MPDGDEQKEFAAEYLDYETPPRLRQKMWYVGGGIFLAVSGVFGFFTIPMLVAAYLTNSLENAFVSLVHRDPWLLGGFVTRWVLLWGLSLMLVVMGSILAVKRSFPRRCALVSTVILAGWQIADTGIELHTFINIAINTSSNRRVLFPVASVGSVLLGLVVNLAVSLAAFRFFYKMQPGKKQLS